MSDRAALACGSSIGDYFLVQNFDLFTLPTILGSGRDTLPHLVGARDLVPTTLSWAQDAGAHCGADYPLFFACIAAAPCLRCASK